MRCQGQLMTLDILPDDVLLEIFDLYVYEDVHEGLDRKEVIEVWIRLTHVCRRWRSVVFQSPLRLNLQLVCTPQTPARDILGIWPPLPLIVRDFNDHYSGAKPSSVENTIAALEHNDRVCRIELVLTELGYFTDSAAILKPFPELTFLQISNDYAFEAPERMLPDSFLGGSAPRLRSLFLDQLSFPGLPKLLLSTTHLVSLELYSIPRSGYIPPEAMATGLSALTSLELLCLQFRYPPSRPAPETRRLPPPLPPPTRTILPSLTKIEFLGPSEYLEVILARIDCPRLNKLDITFFDQLTLDTPQLLRFIGRRPILRALEKGRITFKSWTITVEFKSQADCDVLNVTNLGGTSEWRLSFLEQVCTSYLRSASALEDLYLSEHRRGHDGPHWEDDVENALWLGILCPFIAVKNLYISDGLVPRISSTLRGLVAGRTTEVLPALENIFLEGFQPSRPLQENIEEFIAARRLTSHPVAVSRWDMDSESKEDSETESDD